MPDFTVERHGSDSSGRPIYCTRFFWQVWSAVLADSRLNSFRSRVTVIQGAFMSRTSGGAVASAGYHDLAGCWDVRTWSLSSSERATLYAVAAEYGIWFWERGWSYTMGGMDPHAHAVAGWDAPLASGAAYQWSQAKARRNGLANNGPDYMYRPKPIVISPPASLLAPPKEDYMATDAAAKKLDQIIARLDHLETGLDNFRAASKDRAAQAREHKRELVKAIGGVVDRIGALDKELDEKATKEQVKAAREQLRNTRQALMLALAEDPDVDGAENPSKDALKKDAPPKA